MHTGQHYDDNMSEVFFREMQIPSPAYHLGIGGESHGAMTGRMIERLEQVMIDEAPDVILVYGDTNSTLAATLAASKLNLAVAHVEAGLRSFNMQMPEEINRIVTDRLSRYLFCPTRIAVTNLQREGLENWRTGARSILCGDVMQDGANYYRGLAEPPAVDGLENTFVLATVHRQENTDDRGRLEQIFGALNQIGRSAQVVVPLHPRTRNILQQAEIATDNLTLIDPVGYLNMVWLLEHAKLVMTDSGGLQKEAFFFATPCITLRDETEWVELVEHGFNRLAGADRERILSLYAETEFELDFDLDLYGGGHASEKIVSELLGESF